MREVLCVGGTHAHFYKPSACTLLPVYKPSAWRLGHLVSEQSALLGGLSASRLEPFCPQQTAQLGTLSWRVPFAP